MLDKANDYTDMLYEASDTIKDMFHNIKEFFSYMIVKYK